MSLSHSVFEIQVPGSCVVHSRSPRRSQHLFLMSLAIQRKLKEQSYLMCVSESVRMHVCVHTPMYGCRGQRLASSSIFHHIMLHHCLRQSCLLILIHVLR